MLLLAPNRVVDLQQLVDAVWDDRPPATAKRQIQNCVSALRHELAGSGNGRQPLEAHSPGYEIRVAAEQLDALLFRKLADRGRALTSAGDLGRAVDAFRAALRLWRGPALAGLAGRTIHAGAARLDEERLAIVESCIDVELALGRHHELIGELTEVVESHPLWEPPVGQLMIALQRSGRQADALQEYQRLRARLAEDLGVDPSTALQELHAAVLRNDVRGRVDSDRRPNRAVTGQAARRASGDDVRRNHLPRDVADFTGRGRQIAELVGSLTAALPRASVSTISGKAGVGKTALAVHVGHRLQGQFPDGQLFMNVGGMASRPIAADEALLRLLLLLGVPRSRIPRQPGARQQLYHAQFAAQRLLIVLDDVADEAQIRSLLPVGAGSAALITSRRPLAGLEAVHRLRLSELDQEEAIELLARVAGPARVADEPEGAQRIVELCDRLPLAIRIAGAKLAVKPHWALGELADRLTSEQGRLDELQVGDLAVRASLSLSYRALDPASQQVFSMLGLLNAVDFPAWVPATLMGRAIADVQEVLERLVDAQLLDASRRDPAGRHRYRMHDLLAVFARERLQGSDVAAEKRAGMGRVVGAWLAVVDSMEARLGLRGSSGERAAAGPATAYPIGWLPAQRAALQTSAAQSPDAVWEIGWAITATLVAVSFELWSQWDNWQMTREVALIAGRRVGDRIAAIPSPGEYGVILGRSDPWVDVVADLEKSLSVLEELGEWRWHAATAVSIGNLYRAQGRYNLAASALQRGVDLFSELGHLGWKAAALFSLGSLHVVDGRLADAVAQYEACLAIFRRQGDQLWQAHVHRALGYAFQQHGRFEDAVRALTNCLRILREQDDPMWEAHTLLTLARAEVGMRRFRDASARLSFCIPIFDNSNEVRSHAMALRTLAMAAEGRGDSDVALASLHTCLELFRELDDPVGLAHTLHDLATLHRAHGRNDDAARCYRGCRALFHDLGLAPLAIKMLETQPPSTI